MNKFKIDANVMSSSNKPYDIPLTGSVRTFKNQVIAAEERLQSGIDIGEDKAVSCSKFSKVNDFELAYYYAEYFIGIWQHNITDKKLLSILPAFLGHLFLYGICGLYKDVLGNFIPIQVINNDNKYNSSGQLQDDTIYEVYNVVNNFLGGNHSVDVSGYKNNATTKPFNVKGSDIVLFRWNIFGWGYFVLWKKNIDNYYTLLRYLMNSYPTITKKLLYRGGTYNNSMIELNKFLDPDVGYIQTNTITNNIVDKFKVLGGDHSGNLTLSSSIEVIDYLKQELYTMLGIRINLNDKQERNINSEVQYTQSFFDSKENTWKQNINNGWYYFNELHNTNIVFDTLTISNDTNRNNQDSILDDATIDSESGNYE